MGRWEPDARGRLGQAAMEVYLEHGYEQATVAEIAERAGLTARTFFRYFADKREVLFAGSDALIVHLVDALESRDPAEGPLVAVASALAVVTEIIGGDHEHSRRRQEVIVANADLQERERSKLASWSRSLTEGLHRRGVAEPAASLAAETGVAVFRVAFERWIADPAGQTLREALNDSFDQLRLVTGQA